MRTRPHSRFGRSLWAFVALALHAGLGSAHPQDGPHADIRFAITDAGVRASVGLNLAFLDEVAPTAREAEQSVSGAEATRTLEAAKAYLAENLGVAVGGVGGAALVPQIEHAELAAEPDAALAALFPRTGRRALIRASVLLTYATPGPPSELALTWAGYPRDAFSDEGVNAVASAGGEAPPMVLEAQIQTDAGVTLVRFSEPEPTVRWSRDADAAVGRLVPVPLPASVQAGGSRTVPALSIALAAAALAGLTIAGTSGLLRRAPVSALAACAALAGGAFAVRGRAATPVPAWFPAALANAGPTASLTDADRGAIFDALHTNLYKAFRSPDPGVVYDALAATLDTPLIDPMYNAVFRSLVDAEQGGELGVVTAVVPVSTAFEPAVVAGKASDAGAFRAVRTWRVDGTVYHWGHSHTRTFEYEAAFDVAPTAAGYRVVGHELRAQRRIDPSTGRPTPAALPPGTEL